MKLWSLMKDVGGGQYKLVANWEGRKPSSADINYVIAGFAGEYHLVRGITVITCKNSQYYSLPIGD